MAFVSLRRGGREATLNAFNVLIHRFSHRLSGLNGGECLYII